MRCSVVLRKSRSRGSSESNNSSNCAVSVISVCRWATYLDNKLMIDVGLGNVCIEVLALDESQEEFVDHLDVGPGDLQHRFVFLRVKCFSLGGDRGRDRAEKVLREHFDDPGIHGFSNDGAVVGDVVQEFVKRQPLDLLGFHVGRRIVEVEDDVALIDLLHEKILTAIGRDLMEPRELLQFPLTLIGDIKPRGVLAFGGPNPLRHILGGGLKAIEDMRLSRRRQIPGHCFCGARRWNMLGHCQHSC